MHLLHLRPVRVYSTAVTEKAARKQPRRGLAEAMKRTSLQEFRFQLNWHTSLNTSVARHDMEAVDHFEK